MKHLKKTNLIKSLSGTISVWDLLSSTLESGGLQAFSKELNTLIINLRSLSKSFKIVSNCESNSIDNNQMVKYIKYPILLKCNPLSKFFFLIL